MAHELVSIKEEKAKLQADYDSEVRWRMEGKRFEARQAERANPAPPPP